MYVCCCHETFFLPMAYLMCFTYCYAHHIRWEGTLLDAPTVATLEEPNLHSLHCLLDVPQCVATDYEILLDPLPGQTTYRRGLTLDAASKQLVVDAAEALGTCETCTGGRLKHGFRVNINATILALANETSGAPPLASVSDLQPVLFVTNSATEVTFQVGDRVTVTGFIMDNFCIERGMRRLIMACLDVCVRLLLLPSHHSQTATNNYIIAGTLLDAPTIVTLEQPDMHSLHCLLDVPDCAGSNYEVLLDPASAGELYTRGFVLDDAGKALLTTLGKEVGDSSCTTCDGTGDMRTGFRAQIMGTITALGADGEPPVISVQMATPAPFEGGSMTMTSDATATPAATPAPVPTSTSADGPVDCSTFVSSYAYEGQAQGLTLNYVVTLDDDQLNGNFSAQLVYEGQGWVGFGISPDGAVSRACP
jgi:hypothetical protein